MSERIGPVELTEKLRVRQNKPISMKGRLISTAIALVALVLVLRYLPPGVRNAQAQEQAAARAMLLKAAHAAPPQDLRYSDLVMSNAPGGEAFYLDGLVRNTGNGTVIDATAEVQFLDAQGRVIASVQKPLVGMARGGTDIIPNEFARNPITPNEVRFFRVVVEQQPPNWNHEVPKLKMVAVTVR